ncbi:nucleotide sugar dehydrogenase [Pelagibacterales bacterium SAG-MED23]|nr:nucleotide sugar dehydrogenase [Pelagibacterales bacterium SAG-MED23]
MQNNKIISIIGLGYIGIPMLVCCGINKKTDYKLVGIEKNDERGKSIIEKAKKGILPFRTNDTKLINGFNKITKKQLASYSTDIKKIKDSEIIIVSVSFDFFSKNDVSNIKKLFYDISKYKKKKSLILIETTLPPGVTEKILIPIVKKNSPNDCIVAYSFERVTPGINHMDSIINSHRIYSGNSKISKSLCKKFLTKIINTKKFPLLKMNTIMECEMTKIIENSYRSLNIAFIDEWTKFSIKNNLNLNLAIDAIKLRKTHNNIMRPGLGVGGYCLTKDPLLMNLSSKILKQNNEFILTSKIPAINKKSTETTIRFIRNKYKNKIKNTKILLMGATYKENVDDLRHSASLILKKKLINCGSKVFITDTFNYSHMKTKNFNFVVKPNFKDYDIILFCIGHDNYKNLNFKAFNKFTYFFDLNYIFSNTKIRNLQSKKIKIFQLGT